MVTRPQTHKFQLTVLAAFLALLALIILSAQSYAGARLESVKVATFTRPNSVMHPRVSFAPLAGKRSPAPLANLEAPLAGRRTPAPLANLEAPLAGRRGPAPLANLEAPLAGRMGKPAPLANLEAPLAGYRGPAPLANLEAPLAGRFGKPAPLANLEAPLAVYRGKPAPLANLEAPLAGRRTPAPLALQDVERESTAGLRFHPAMALPLLFLVRFIIKAIDEKLNKS